MKKAIFVILGLLICSYQVLAIVATPNSNEVNFGITEYVILEIDSGFVDFGDLNPANSPATLSKATTLNVKSNLKNNWTLKAQANGDLVSSQYPEETIPINKLKLKGGDLSSFTSLSVSPLTIRTAPAGQEEISIDYQLAVDYSDAAASGYQTRITYELVAQE